MNELYLYTAINNESAQGLMQSLEAVGNAEDVDIRICSPGGGVFAFWGIAAKCTERTGTTTMKVDGLAASAAAMMLLYADNVEALETSNIMIHRADMYVSSPEDQQFLDKINNDLKDKMTAKIDGKKLKELKGISIKDLFNPDTRIDCWLNAKEAKAIGLVTKINKVNPKEAAAFAEKYLGIAAEIRMPEEVAQTKVLNSLKNKSQMDLATLKAEHPALYAEVFAAGITAGVAQEKDRVEAALVFNEIDPAGVKAAIESGKPLSPKQAFEFMLKQNNAEALKKLSAESAEKVETGATEAQLTEEQKKKAAIEADLDRELGLSTKK